ncbi:MAG: hypothetical protein O7B99_10665 [Planctomycetota bacterium]|nr:hypothetical protein [Planctomycetota bacterium]
MEEKTVDTGVETKPAFRPATRLPSYTGLEEIGRGRSGVVYRERDGWGNELACKVFDSRGLTKLVQWIFLGSPNPYMWNEDAIRCAHLRREILRELLEVWFEGRLRVAGSHGFAWNDPHRAFELQTEFVHGRPPGLHHPLRARRDDRLHEIADELMPVLCAKLVEAGFVGSVWQAGRGNPVALNNFLLEPDGRWAWIDLESGVPALAALDPRALLGFYVPLAIRLRRAPFDDADTTRLRAYVEGDDRLGHLREAVDELEQRQRRWKSLRRIDRAIGYRLGRGDIDEIDAAWFRKHPVRWYARETRRALSKAFRKLPELARRLVRKLARIPWRALAVGAGRFLTSQEYRARLARGYVNGRIDAWRERNQMSSADAECLRGHVEREESSDYLTDFGVHLAIKPFVKSIEYWVCPLLFAAGLISGGTLAFVLLTAGALARTAYTGGRLVQSTLRGREKPWIALFVGVLPVVGNFAYPLQLLYSSRIEEDDLARFILYDGCARIGEKLPIWGGRDTLTEHRLNRLPDRLVKLRKSPG